MVLAAPSPETAISKAGGTVWVDSHVFSGACPARIRGDRGGEASVTPLHRGRSSAFARQRDTVADRQYHLLDSTVCGTVVVEDADCLGVVVGGVGVDHPPLHSTLSTAMTPPLRTRGTSSSQ